MKASQDRLTPSDKTNSLTNQTLTIDDLRQTALGQFQRIQQQEKTIIQVQSNLDLLMKRYNVEKGLFSRAAEWYGSQAWWLKIIFGLIVIGVAVGIGALCHMPLALGCTAAGLYLFIAFLFINHHIATEKRNKRLCEDVLEMEHSLNDAVSHFAALCDSLKKVMLNLCEMNCQMTQHIEKFDAQHQELNEKLLTYQTMVNTLTNAKTNLTEEIDRITQKLQEVNHLYQTTETIVSSQSTLMTKTTHDISTIHAHLVHDEALLKKETEALHTVTDLITRCYEEFQPIFATLNQMVTESQSEQPQLDNTTSSESDIKHQTPDLTHLETICTKAQTLIQQNTAEQRTVTTDNPCVGKPQNHTESVIERAQALLKKRANRKVDRTPNQSISPISTFFENASV